MKLVLIALSQALLVKSLARTDPPNQTGYVDAPYPRSCCFGEAFCGWSPYWKIVGHDDSMKP